MKVKKKIGSYHRLILPLAYIQCSYCPLHLFLTCTVLLTFTSLFIYYSGFCSFLTVIPAPWYQPVFSEFDTEFLLSSPGIWNSLFLVIWYDFMPFFQLPMLYNFFRVKIFYREVKSVVNWFNFPTVLEKHKKTYISPRHESENC